MGQPPFSKLSTQIYYRKVELKNSGRVKNVYTTKMENKRYMSKNTPKNENAPEDAVFEMTLRPRSFDEYVGQHDVKENLKIAIEAARIRTESLEHILLFGPAGIGKTTLAYLIAREMKANVRATSGPAIERAGDLASILTNLEAGDVLFIDEAHRLPRAVEEVLYPAMESHMLDIVLGKGTAARTFQLKLQPFTLIAATTRVGLLSSPMRSRFGQTFRLDFYTPKEIEQILKRSATLLGVTLDSEARPVLAQASRQTPRVANRLLKRTRDLAQVEGKETNVRISKDLAERALKMLDIDERGLDRLDRAMLKALIEKFRGGPAGVQSLAAALKEEEDTLLESVEPYLMKLGMVVRTPRGRYATPLAYEHLGLPKPRGESLFDERKNL